MLENMLVCNCPSRHDDLNNSCWGMIRGKSLNKPIDNRCSNLVQMGKFNNRCSNRCSNR